MTEALIPVNLLLIVAGFYALPHIPRRPALAAALAVSLGMSLLRAILLYDALPGIPLYFLSCLAGAIVIYALAAKFDNLLAMFLITPIGCILLLFGGPIMIGMSLYEFTAKVVDSQGG